MPFKQEIVKDLRQREIITSGNQILDFDLFRDASAHKVAEMVYTLLGEAYSVQRASARANYKEEMKNMSFGIDRDKDGRKDEFENFRSNLVVRM